MSFVPQPEPFLNEPPVFDDMFREENKLSDIWLNWFNNIRNTTGITTVHLRYNRTTAPADKRGTETVITKFAEFTQPERDGLNNVPDGAAIYNLTTNRVNFRENGAWWTFLQVPA